MIMSTSWTACRLTSISVWPPGVGCNSRVPTLRVLSVAARLRKSLRALHEAHSLLASSVDTAISDVFAKGLLDDPLRSRRLEDAYAELVNAGRT